MKRKYAPLSDRIVNQSQTQFPIAVKRARNITLYDYNQNKYFDFFLNHGANILGYSHKTLSTTLKNTISYGFMNAYPNHAKLNAKKALKDFFSCFPFFKESSFELFLCYSRETLFLNLKNYHQHDLDIIDLTTLSKADKTQEIKAFFIGNELSLLDSFSAPWHYLIVENIIANGYPLCILIKNQDLDFSCPIKTDDEFPLIVFPSIIKTIRALSDQKGEKIFEKLLAPYQKKVDYKGFGAFSIKNLSSDFYIEHKIATKLLERGILTNPSKPLFHLSLQTGEHQLRYFLSSLKNLSNLEE
jgi:hypothetical protein